MKGTIALFNRRGNEEVRIYFPQYELDGQIIEGVTVYPHPCTQCAGGDHTHVDVYESPLRIVNTDSVSLTREQKEAVDAHLRAADALNRMTSDLVKIIEQYQT